MTHKTKGIVLRSINYGETSVITSVYTELFGLQSYIVKGVRQSTKKTQSKQIYFQPGAMLEMEVYHNELKQLQRIKEFRWSTLYKNIFSDVPKNAVSLFMVELLTKCVKQPEGNPELYEFAEDAFMHLDQADGAVMANFPLFFALHLPVFFGFRISDNYTAERAFLDLEEGRFSSEQPMHRNFIEDKQAFITSQLLKVQQPAELADIKLNHDFRRNLLHIYESYYALHIQDFGKLKTLPVLRELLG